VVAGVDEGLADLGAADELEEAILEGAAGTGAAGEVHLLNLEAGG
jgi:hypothetical protein